MSQELDEWKVETESRNLVRSQLSEKLGWPKLQGTGAQILWASDLRYDFYKLLELCHDQSTHQLFEVVLKSKAGSSHWINAKLLIKRAKAGELTESQLVVHVKKLFRIR